MGPSLKMLASFFVAKNAHNGNQFSPNAQTLLIHPGVEYGIL